MEYINTFSGSIIKGHNRGKAFGFPTINMLLTQDIAEGVYISHILLVGKQFNGLTFIGAAKTFGEEDSKAETHLFNFSDTVYGEDATVMLIKKIRGNITFKSADDLIKEMQKDKFIAEEYFKNS